MPVRDDSTGTTAPTTIAAVVHGKPTYNMHVQMGGCSGVKDESAGFYRLGASFKHISNLPCVVNEAGRCVPMYSLFPPGWCYNISSVNVNEAFAELKESIENEFSELRISDVAFTEVDITAEQAHDLLEALRFNRGCLVTLI